MLLPEEVAYGVIPVEGRASTGALHQETFHSVHRGGQKDRTRLEHGLGTSAHTSRTEERASDIPTSSRNSFPP